MSSFRPAPSPIYAKFAQNRELNRVRDQTIIHTVCCHAEGEVGDVITAGLPVPPGDTLWQLRAWPYPIAF